MSSEFLLEVFSIKIKIKGYLKNETEKTTDTIYYIKEYKSEIPIKIHTKYIKKVNNYIEIAYKTIDNEIEYIYNIEMSDV